MLLLQMQTPARQCACQQISHPRLPHPGGFRRGYRVAVRAYDTVDVEPERLPPPDAGPGRWGGGPPPPPPPPRPDLRRSPPAPSRREALFGFLGAGIGTAITATYYNTQYDLSDDSYERALDALLDNPEFLSTVEDEVLYKVYGSQLDELGENLENMQTLDKELSQLKDDLERITEEPNKQ